MKKSSEPDPATPEGMEAWLVANVSKFLSDDEKITAAAPKLFKPGEALEDVVPDDLGA